MKVVSRTTAAPPAVDEGDPPGALALLWLQLAPAPGRLGNTLRLVVLVLLAVTLSEVFRIPQPAISAYVVLFVSRGEMASSVLTAAVAGTAVILALLLTIVVFSLSLAEPALRIPLVAAATFIAMFLSRAAPLGPAFFAAGFIIAYGLTFGDQVSQLSLLPATAANTPDFTLPELAFVPPEEALVHFLLWLGLAVAMPVALVIAANLLTGYDPAQLLRDALADRLGAAARLCRGEPGAERDLAALLGAGSGGLLKLDHLSGLLHRRRPRHDITPVLIREVERLGLVLLAWGRLPPSGFPQTLLRQAGSFCDRAQEAIRRGRRLSSDGLELTVPGDAAARPLGLELGRALRKIQAHLDSDGAPAQTSAATRPPRQLLVADAFSNPGHTRFAFKVTLAVMLCYATETLTDWPAIHTCMITCFFVSLDTVGETVHKASLRVAGCLVGGSLGIGAILLLMPLMTDLGDLLLLLGAVTLLAGWIANGTDRIAYAGWQIGIAFYLSVLQGYGPTLDMQTARDRIIGILLGNVVVFVVFTTIWPVRVAVLVRERLARGVDQFARLMDAIEPKPAAQAQPDGIAARDAFGTAIAQARALLANDVYEGLSGRALPRPHAIDATILDRVQKLIVPASVFLDLDADPVWKDVADPARETVLAYHRSMAAWFRDCAVWVRKGDGAALLRATLPEPPDAPTLMTGARDPTTLLAAHLEARAFWYGLLHRDLCRILEELGPGQAAAFQQRRNVAVAQA